MMKDFISDEEMNSLELKSSPSSVSAASDFISDDEMEKLDKSQKTNTNERSALEIFKDATNVLNWPANIAAGAKKIDEYTGAPIRKFVTEAVTGRELEKAPTGAEQAKMMGATDKTYGEQFGVPSYLGGNISPADIYGVGLEFIQDPFVIGSGAMKGLKKLSSGASSLVENFGAKQTVNAAQRQAAEASATSAARSGAKVSGGGLTVEQGGQLFEKKAPQSLDELRSWKPQNGTGAVPGKARLGQIESIVPDLETKPLKYHYDMMENPKAMKELKLKFENLPTEDAKKIAAYNQEIVDESAKKIRETVNDISGYEPKNLADAGNDFIAAAKDKYNAEKDALGPVFQKIQKSPRLSRPETMDLARAIGENSKIGKLLNVGEDGRLFLQKNTPRTGISDAEHSVLSRVIDDMNDGMTFKEIQDTRDFLRKSMDQTNPAATSEIAKVRSIMLGQLEVMAEKHGVDVADTFKRYAINERTRENVEHIIGGKIDTLDAMFAANPDRVVKKIFSNPNYAKVVGEYVGEEKMNELVASYIQTGLDKAFDSAKGFQPHAFKAWLKSNSQFLNANASPEVTERLSALADYGYYGKRFLDEVNPSGTAASLLEALEPKSFSQKVRNEGISAAIMSEAAGRVNSKVRQSQAIKSVNEMLGTKQPGVGDAIKSNLRKFPDVSQKVEAAKNVSTMGALARGTIQDSSALRNTSDREKPKKGPEKWVLDGIEKLNQAGVDRSVLDSLSKTKEGKQLLIEASSAEHKSKRMEAIIKKLRTATNQGGQ